MTTVEDVKKEVIEKIDLLPFEALKEAEDVIKIRIEYLVTKFEGSTLITEKRFVSKVATQLNKLPSIDSTWQIQSLFGIKVDKEFLTSDFVENLFKNADFEFYINKENTHIFSQNNELLEHDFGKLKSISALDAFHKFGIEVLEKAKESVYVKSKLTDA